MTTKKCKCKCKCKGKDKDKDKGKGKGKGKGGADGRLHSHPSQKARWMGHPMFWGWLGERQRQQQGQPTLHD
jgi:hypothetical protein